MWLSLGLTSHCPSSSLGLGYTGKAAICVMLDDRQLRPHVDLTAVVGAKYKLLLGALEVIQSRGISIPGDIANIRFGNIVQGKAHTPPLASVGALFYERAYQGVKAD